MTRTDRIDSSLEHGRWDIERSLRSDVPISPHVGSVDEYCSLTPALLGGGGGVECVYVCGGGGVVVECVYVCVGGGGREG